MSKAYPIVWGKQVLDMAAVCLDNGASVPDAIDFAVYILSRKSEAPKKSKPYIPGLGLNQLHALRSHQAHQRKRGRKWGKVA